MHSLHWGKNSLGKSIAPPPLYLTKPTLDPELCASAATRSSHSLVSHAFAIGSQCCLPNLVAWERVSVKTNSPPPKC